MSVTVDIYTTRVILNRVNEQITEDERTVLNLLLK